MADNFDFTPGTGAIGAADEIGGVKYPRVKTTWGPDGTANDADVATGKPLPVQLRGSDGTDRSNALPVTIASVPSHAVTNAGTFAVQAAATVADGADVTIGAKADAKSTATDTTAVTLMQVMKECSYQLQALGSALSSLTNTANAIDVNVKSGVNANGQATMANSSPVVPASNWVYNTGYYVAVAASQTAAELKVSAGATGDYLAGVLVIPATTAPGVVTILDNATTLIAYPGGGTTALLTLTPFYIPVGAVSRSGAWKITTGANVSVLAMGRFS